MIYARYRDALGLKIKGMKTPLNTRLPMEARGI